MWGSKIDGSEMAYYRGLHKTGGLQLFILFFLAKKLWQLYLFKYLFWQFGPGINIVLTNPQKLAIPDN